MLEGMRAFWVALTFLTRVPVRLTPEVNAADLGPASGYYPVVGALVGLAVGSAYLAARLALPPVLAAAVAVALGLLLTGAFHEDALGDVADGFGGGFTRERKLEIMKDSRHGTYGVLAMTLALLVRVGSIAALPPAIALPALVAIHAVSRTGVVWLLGLPPAREGLGAETRDASWSTSLLATGFGAVCATALLGGAALPLAMAAGLAALSMARLTMAQIGGITGDVLGTTQQVTELLGLLVAVALFTHPEWGLGPVAPWLR